MGSPSVCSPICGDGMVVGPEACDDYNANACGLCNADCSATIPTGMRVQCANGVGCDTNADCTSGNCGAGHVCRNP
jgi:cysteine-rich repeat protein